MAGHKPQYLPISLLVLVLIICSHSLSAESTGVSFQISILDFLPPTSPDLFVVCRVQNKEVARAELKFNGEVAFNYNASPLDSVTCGVAPYAVYEIFNYGRDINRCGHDHKCSWTATQTGLYQYFDGSLHLVFPWH